MAARIATAALAIVSAQSGITRSVGDPQMQRDLAEERRARADLGPIGSHPLVRRRRDA